MSKKPDDCSPSADYLITAVDKLDIKIDEIDKTLIRNTISLEHHIMRTDKLQELIELHKAELVPIKNHVQEVTHAVRGIFFFCTIVAGIAGFVLMLKQIGIIP